MAGNAGRYHNKEIPDYLLNRPLYFMKTCVANIQKAREQINPEMISEENGMFKVCIFIIMLWRHIYPFHSLST